MSSLVQLIHFAHEAFSKSGGIPPLHHDAFEAVRCAAGMTVSDFMDHFARCVAHRYHDGELEYEVADCALNSLNSYCLSQHQVMLPSYANDVYLAFDQGEYMHADDDVGTDPEAKYTKPQIQAIVTRDRILGVAVSN
ncbi:hypothetical protein [Duganella sp. Root1480D1]|uniref:hypothetical protein n=1 Tax=Duganella sp. Root1480D1 TaxID=1736471 RepID=UPI0007089A18|nr:hypothetical protein [Duganella sp. Root1480D1]